MSQGSFSAHSSGSNPSASDRSGANFSATDHRHMARALQLARRGLFTTQPNPRVGCVLARGEEVVGEGWHQVAGGPHAEVGALEQAGAAARGATAYVTLEPCHHQGRTPPCRKALIEAGVGRVVAAMEDPFPQVAGKGLAALRVAGVTTQVGLLADQARDLNAGFVSRFERKRPFVRVKLASSLDGRTALSNGDSKWITGPAARVDVQRWRARSCAIVTGSGTVKADDPRLNVRIEGLARQPMRVVLDSKFSVHPGSRIFNQAGECVVIGAGAQPPSLLDTVRRISLGDEARPDLGLMLRWLANQSVNEAHVEAGETLAGALLQAELVDEILLYVAPNILGSGSRGLFALPVLESMAERINLEWIDVRQVGANLCLRLRPSYS